MNTATILWRDLLRQVRLLPLIAFFTTLPLSAQIPSLINYQGRLTDAQGNPVTGNRTMAVKIYDAPTGGNMTYQETIGTVAVRNGTYTFSFGASGNGVASVLKGQDHLTLTVNGTEEATRTRLLAVPYALKSADTQALTPQVSSLSGNLSIVQGQTSALSSNVSALSSNVTALSTQSSAMSGNLSALVSRFRVLELSGNLSFGNSSTTRQLTISNTGFDRLTVSGISYPAGFSGNWTGVVPAFGSQTVAVTFAPPAAQSYAGNITVSSDATGGGAVIPVSGTGARLISVSGNLAFGNVTVNSTATRNFTISNTGTMNLTVSGVTYPSRFSGNWSGTIPAGGSRQIEVTFNPIVAQSYGGNLSVVSNASAGSGLLAVSGVGVSVPTANLITVQGGTLPQSSGLNGTVVSAFQIGKFEVTWDEWQEVRTWAVANGYSDLANVGAGSAGNHPVRDVNWFDIVKWSNAMSEKEGLVPVYQVSGAVYKTGQSEPTMNSSANGYRLPTDAEWEWAARGGVSSQGYTYSGSNDVNAVAWYFGNSGDGTKAVGTKAANELGIHDMSGNVWEWCWDVAFTPPRRLRGGSWGDFADYCPVANRGYSSYPDYRYSAVGFRLARSSGN